MSKSKVVVINDRPVVVEYGKDFAELTLYGHNGTVNFSTWVWDKKEKEKNLKAAVKLANMVDLYIEKVQAMEVREDA